MNNIESLKAISTKRELAALLGVSTPTLTHILYKLTPAKLYHQFVIPKRNGGERVINAPDKKLKLLQRKLADLLQNCLEEINLIYFPKPDIKASSLSHGFVKKRSIYTNASMHLNKNNVLNIDLNDFFDSFNFGRVRGYFISNKNFELHKDIATLIAQIACYDNKLPQGSPCSPVITNLITHALDIKLAKLARKYSCIYTRYADDITFSTRESVFPSKIMAEIDGEYTPGKRLRNEITRSGFSINMKKTRIQYKDSRQDVTGLVVNEKPNIKKEYWKTVRAQCNSLFQTGSFITKTPEGEITGNIHKLHGQLNFIDFVGKNNRKRQKNLILNPAYQSRKSEVNTYPLLTGKEKIFSKFLYYRLFYGNSSPTILCEGKTDNIHLKSAIHQLAHGYPKLAVAESLVSRYKLLVRFVNYNARTKFLLQLNGGDSYLNFFITNFRKNYNFFNAPKPTHPVILIFDNDSGFNKASSKLLKLKATSFPASIKDDFRQADFIHVMHNLYIVLIPRTAKDEDTNIESWHERKTLLMSYDKRIFNTPDKRDENKDLSKESFATNVVKLNKTSINFDGFKPLLNRIESVIEHYAANS